MRVHLTARGALDLVQALLISPRTGIFGRWYVQYRCFERVPSCGAQRMPDAAEGCHVYYKCIDGVAYSCQNPKLLSSTCSEKYYFGSRNKYKCPADSPGGQQCA